MVPGAGNRDNMAQHIARCRRADVAQVAVCGRKRNDPERFAKEIGGHTLTCDITSQGQIFAFGCEARVKNG